MWDPDGNSESKGWHRSATDDSSWHTVDSSVAWEEQVAGRQWKPIMENHTTVLPGIGFGFRHLGRMHRNGTASSLAR